MRAAIGIGIGVLATIAWVTPNFAADPGERCSPCYGTGGYDEGSGNTPIAWNYDTQEEADKAAMKGCPACKIVIRFGPKKCAAIAVALTAKIFGVASGSTTDEVKDAAVADCKKNGASICIVHNAECNL